MPHTSNTLASSKTTGPGSAPGRDGMCLLGHPRDHAPLRLHDDELLAALPRRRPEQSAEVVAPLLGPLRCLPRGPSAQSRIHHFQLSSACMIEDVLYTFYSYIQQCFDLFFSIDRQENQQIVQFKQISTKMSAMIDHFDFNVL